MRPSARRRSFHAHQERGFKLRLRARYLGPVKILADTEKVIGQTLAEFPDLLFARSGIDGKGARIHEGGGEGKDRVAEPAPLPDLLEEPRGHAAAEQADKDLH